MTMILLQGQHILYIWPYVVNNKLEGGGGGGAKVYTFGKVFSLESPKISPAEP